MRFEQLKAMDYVVLQCGVPLRWQSVKTTRFFKSLSVEEDFGVAAVLPGVPVFSSVWLKSGHGGVGSILLLPVLAPNIRVFQSNCKKAGSRNTINLIRYRVSNKGEGEERDSSVGRVNSRAKSLLRFRLW